jgi:hypothetical protein
MWRPHLLQSNSIIRRSVLATLDGETALDEPSRRGPRPRLAASPMVVHRRLVDRLEGLLDDPPPLCLSDCSGASPTFLVSKIFYKFFRDFGALTPAGQYRALAGFCGTSPAPFPGLLFSGKSISWVPLMLPLSYLVQPQPQQRCRISKPPGAGLRAAAPRDQE